jgi:IS605 OrfB family transposase
MLNNKKQGGENMSQTITVKIKLLPTKEQAVILTEMSRTYISTINNLVSEMVKEKKSTKKTSKNIDVSLPSAVKNQAIKDAKSVFKKAKKRKFETVPVLNKPMCIWNNQNYSFDFTHISLPIMIDGKAKKTPIRALLVDKDNRNFDLLKHKLGTLRITKKTNKWIAQISVTIPTTQKTGLKVMGVDLGLKVPAVAVTDDGKVRFFGNGRQNKFKKRKFRSVRKKLAEKKKLNAIRKINNKEQRWMEDKDHKVSRAIVNFAIENKISVIRLERLANIRQTTRTSRKNEKNLHTWSFYRLSQFIEYKAKLEGIKVEYVNPAYTSQTCPKCSERNKAQDRKYKCKCGFEGHRDIIGAMNIRYVPVVDGKSQSA